MYIEFIYLSGATCISLTVCLPFVLVNYPAHLRFMKINPVSITLSPHYYIDKSYNNEDKTGVALRTL